MYFILYTFIFFRVIFSLNNNWMFFFRAIVFKIDFSSILDVIDYNTFRILSKYNQNLFYHSLVN